MHLVKDLVVPAEVLETLYSARRVHHSVSEPLAVNSYVVFRSEVNQKQTAFTRHLGHGNFILCGGTYKLGSITTRDSHQSAFADAMLAPDITVNVALGLAGSGKSSLGLSYACEQYLMHKKKIILCKPAVMIGHGKAFGAVPGSFDEKYAPYLASFEIVLKKLLTNKADVYLKQMVDNKDLEFIPLELARGCTYENCTFILDEAQNCTWPEMNTLLSRIGENSKFIALGDLNQIDIRVPARHTGLYTLVNSTPFAASPICSVIELKTQYRSAICQLATEIHEWVQQEHAK